MLPSNNVAYTFNTALNLNMQNGGSLSYPSFDSRNQQELWNYYPKTNAVTANVVLGQSQQINVNLKDLNSYGLANYAGSITIGTRTGITETSPSQYNFTASIASFVPSAYGIANPAPRGSKSIPVAAVVQLSYNGRAVYRNVTTSFVSPFQSGTL